ncbi:acyl-CoA dehydrogenase family protein [Sandaracinobacter sp. RS1-74]|uniref:acyl-CoA dehydrogenase family protein n=1 Tax=Sandaracinobacteroides sayramensis TaxID=2913411 RepID=UPI001EDBE374|nr:acyl-CoA dehydrogenase family protein [Sandaracinobacteroides sayramensis]MCG2840929.1 acyl-CoA dehydrogenase family protein [Sandaracinobacteroides sayramensis]
MSGRFLKLDPRNFETEESPYGEEMEMFRNSVRAFFDREVEPRYRDFEVSGTDRAIWKKAAEYGILGATIPEAYGGPGANRFSIMVAAEELGYAPSGATAGSFIGTDICTNFLVDFGTEAQRRKYFPLILSGDCIQAMGMTEAESGSDAFAARTTAVRDGDEWVINGSKIYISNGSKADLVYVLCKTAPELKAKGLSMIIVEKGTPGFTQRRMITQGYKGGDTGELFLDDVRVPLSNLVGPENGAASMFVPNMALDRLQIVARSIGAAQRAFELTLEHCQNRRLFGQRLIDFQNTRFVLAQMETEIRVGRAFYNSLLRKVANDTITDAESSMAKIWLTELEFRTLDNCVQLWGGQAWMDDHPISRMFTAARVQRIFAGATELMKDVLGRRYLK